MSSRPRLLILLILVGANSIGIVATSLYIPSIPDMARDLGVSAGQVQLTITVFLAAYAVGMLPVGALSDRFGRRSVLMIGMVVFTVASMVAAVVHDINVLLAMRVLQAFGGCAGMAVARAVVRDLFDRDNTARALAAIAGAVTVAPAIAPILGGYVHVWFGWHYNFLGLGIAALVLLVAIAFWLPETNRTLQTEGGLLRGMSAGVGVLLRNRLFYGYTLLMAGAASTYFSFVTSTPVLLIDRFGLSPTEFGYYMLVTPTSYFLGAMSARRLVNRFGIDPLTVAGSALILVGALVLLALAGHAAPWAVMGPVFILGFGQGLGVPNANAGLVSIFPHLAGTASGLAGSMQMVIASLATVAMAAVTHTSALPLGIMCTIGATVAVFGALLAGWKPQPAEGK